jgi:hypothetical protein
MSQPRYTRIWAFDRPDEKRAFEELVDFITERRRRHPGLDLRQATDNLIAFEAALEDGTARDAGQTRGVVATAPACLCYVTGCS